MYFLGGMGRWQGGPPENLQFLKLQGASSTQALSHRKTESVQAFLALQAQVVLEKLLGGDVELAVEDVLPHSPRHTFPGGHGQLLREDLLDGFFPVRANFGGKRVSGQTVPATAVRHILLRIFLRIFLRMLLRMLIRMLLYIQQAKKLCS